MLTEARRQKGLWWDISWNPVTGCTKISEGCAKCWAEKMARRFGQRWGLPKDDPFQVVMHWGRVADTSYLKEPAWVFVCSMGDLFHEDVNPVMCHEVMSRAVYAPKNVYLLLTKRPQNIAVKLEQWFRENENKLPPNVWAGVSVENQKRGRERIHAVLGISAALHFVNCEPLLEELHVSPWLADWGSGLIDWVIAGCESGVGRRPAKRDWFRKLRDQCLEAGVPFFLKQMAENENGSGKVIHAPFLDGRQWLQHPEDAKS